MDPDLDIPSRIQDPNLKPLHPLYVDSLASLHVNMTIGLLFARGCKEGGVREEPGAAGEAAARQVHQGHHG